LHVFNFTRDKSGFSDPVVFIRLKNREVPSAKQEQHTATLKKTLAPHWDETFFFDTRMKRDDFMRTKLRFDVYDANTIMRNELIGSFEFDLVWHHPLKRQHFLRAKIHRHAFITITRKSKTRKPTTNISVSGSP